MSPLNQTPTETSKPMEETNTPKPLNDGDEWRPFGIMDQFLPLNSSAFITTALWRRLAGPDEQHPKYDRYDQMCLRVTFAVLGLIAAEREQTPMGESLLVPLPFVSGQFTLRVTAHRWFDGSFVLILSLPGQRIVIP
jgi:hypothetical protein